MMISKRRFVARVRKVVRVDRSTPPAHPLRRRHKGPAHAAVRCVQVAFVPRFSPVTPVAQQLQIIFVVRPARPQRNNVIKLVQIINQPVAHLARVSKPVQKLRREPAGNRTAPRHGYGAAALIDASTSGWALRNARFRTSYRSSSKSSLNFFDAASVSFRRSSSSFRVALSVVESTFLESL